jgi:hypothetical protein
MVWVKTDNGSLVLGKAADRAERKYCEAEGRREEKWIMRSPEEERREKNCGTYRGRER